MRRSNVRASAPAFDLLEQLGKVLRPILGFLGTVDYCSEGIRTKRSFYFGVTSEMGLQKER